MCLNILTKSTTVEIQYEFETLEVFTLFADLQQQKFSMSLKRFFKIFSRFLSTTVEIQYEFETPFYSRSFPQSTTVEIQYEFETVINIPETQKSTTVEIQYEFETAKRKNIQINLQQQKFSMSLKHFHCELSLFIYNSRNLV